MKTKSLKAILSRLPIILTIALFVGMYLMTAAPGSSSVKGKNGKTYIVDVTGERWDVTQAVSLGFDPDGFEFGIGRNAFITLDDSLLTGDTSGLGKNARIIGVGEGSEARAYSIATLRGHEISNSFMGSQAIAVAY